MIPIRDQNPTHRTAVVTIGLIIVNTLVFTATWLQSDRGEQAVWKFGFLPAGVSHSSDEIRDALEERRLTQRPQMLIDQRGRFVGVVRPPDVAESAVALPAVLKLFTCMFMHGGWMHLIGNMVYLWVFGNNIEDRLGRGLFIVFYLVTGVVGTLAHTWIEARGGGAGLVPLVGASGAISGVLGAYFLLYPHARVEALVPLGWYLTTVVVPAWVFLGIYVAMQVMQGLPALAHTGGGGVAYWAHLGGFAAGLALIKLLPAQRHTTILPPPLDDDDRDGGWARF